MSNRLPPIFPMPAAVHWGEDVYGLFQDIDILGVIQRMRWIPPGSFFMGSPEEERSRLDDENRQFLVMPQGFWLANTAVTQMLWQLVMTENPSEFKGELLPVEQVSWLDCQRFINVLNRASSGMIWRLPSEAEWEYACRAGTTTAFCFGEVITLENANYSGRFNSDEGALLERGLSLKPEKATVEVKRYFPNSWGVYQMHGNVWEWCSSPWTEQADGQFGDRTERVLRGGSWDSLGRHCRSAFRDHDHADFYHESIGLRLVLCPELE